MMALFARLPASAWVAGVGVVLLLSLSGYAWVQTKRVEVLSDKVAAQTDQLKDTSAKLSEAKQKLSVVEEEAQKQQARLRQAEQKRQVVVQKVTEKVVELRQQKVPQECAKAIEFAIDRKGDLDWPQ